MILLFDIGNTNTHVGLADGRCVLKQMDIPTREWFGGKAKARVAKFAGAKKIQGAALCSVVPNATPLVRKAANSLWKLNVLELSPRTLHGVGIDYPKPHSIRAGPLGRMLLPHANISGAPVVVVDFWHGGHVRRGGRARGNYVGGINVRPAWRR